MHPLLLLPLAGAVIGSAIRVAKSKRNRFSYLEGRLNEGATDVKLYSGPRYGQVVLTTMPVVVGGDIPAEELGIRATDAVRGQYVVTELDETTHRAVAKWVLAPQLGTWHPGNLGVTDGSVVSWRLVGVGRGR